MFGFPKGSVPVFLGRVPAVPSELAGRRPAAGRGLVLAATLSTAFLGSLRADDQSTAEKVVATCVDAEGKPVAGAEVHLFQFVGAGEEGRYVQAGPFLSGEDGKATCSEAVTNDGGTFDRWFYARVPGRLVGVSREAKWKTSRITDRGNEVVMQPSQEVEGRVTVPAGHDPTKVTILVKTLHVTTGPSEWDYKSFPREDHFPGLDTSLPSIFEAHPDAEGRFRFRDVPKKGRLYLVTRAPGLAEAQWSNSRDKEGRFGEPIQMNFEEESLLTGRVLAPDGKPAVGMKVTARLSESGRNAYLSSFHVATDDEGRFTIHGLPPTEFNLSVVDPRKSWTFRPLRDVLAQPRQDQPLKLDMEAGVRVVGTVRDPDGRPVEGAAISALTDEPNGVGLADDMTKADGRFELHLPSGGAKLYFNALPDGFAYPEPQVFKHLRIEPAAGDVKGLDFTLQRKQK